MKKALAAIIGFLLVFSSAFAECVLLPDALTRIEASAFASNSSLTRILFGENLVFIGKNAFAGCKVNNFLSKKRPYHIFINKKSGLTIDNLKKNV